VCAVLAATASLVSVASTERSNASREVTRMSPAART
jgi:hypothetical protein